MCWRTCHPSLAAATRWRPVSRRRLARPCVCRRCLCRRWPMQPKAPAGLKVYDGTSPTTTNGNNGAGASLWLAPEPLVAQSETAAYPIDSLPTAIRHAVEEVQAFVQAPIEMVAASALTAL